MTEKSLDKWLFDIRSLGKRVWLTFYEEMLGQTCSSPQRLYRAINLYGDLIVMEAIVDSSIQSLQGDVINYVLKVAANKWKTSQQQETENYEYLASIEQAKASTIQRNKQLAGKLKRRGKRK